MTAIIGVGFTLVLLGGTAVVFTERPTRQALMLSAYGVMLSILFLSLSAPDVALSQIGVGAAVVPLVVMLAIKRIQTPPEP